MHHIHALIVDLTLITIYAGITTLICKKLKQPIVLGYVVAGILAGPFFNLLPTVSDRENLTLWADIGVIFLLFGLGLEFSFKKDDERRQSGNDYGQCQYSVYALFRIQHRYSARLVNDGQFFSRQHDFNVVNDDYH